MFRVTEKENRAIKFQKVWVNDNEHVNYVVVWMELFYKADFRKHLFNNFRVLYILYIYIYKPW